MKKLVYFALVAALIVVLSAAFWPEYMLQHSYYFKMLKSNTNWAIFLTALLFSFLWAAWFVFLCKKINLPKILITLFVLWFIFSATVINIKLTHNGYASLL